MAKSWIFRWSRDQIVSWLLSSLWGLPFVSAVTYGVWAYIRGPLGPEVFLGVLAAFMVGIVIVSAVRAQLAFSKGAEIVGDLRTLVLAHDEERAKPTLAPTVEMLEAGRRKVEERRENRIDAWRTMVAEVHRTMRREQEAADRGDVQDIRSATELLEGDERFLSLRRRLSEQTKAVLWPTPMTDHLVMPRLPDGSVMDAGLRCVLDDIDALAKHWALD